MFYYFHSYDSTRSLCSCILEKATPAADSQLQVPPNEIVLEFNERLEKELYSIKVFNEEGEMVSEGKTEISQDQKYINATLCRPFLMETMQYPIACYQQTVTQLKVPMSFL